MWYFVNSSTCLKFRHNGDWCNMVFKPGQSGNPSGMHNARFMTDALKLYLLRPADLPANKPRNAAEAIAAKMVQKAVDGDNEAAKMIYDRMEGKAIQTIKDETDRQPMDIMDAARRIAFLLNSASILGEPVNVAFKDITPAPALLEGDKD